ncbi:hypothetical protein CKO31_22635 [Thiohalocapsa halophila]|uniref:N-acetyltransferase domain-containing protein n=1 Tax=Thiohalocapsa halophila TaxID=69359 RepID=A0ABS1CNS3_9GAMM|nr:hypothetical protein [Thiohalocapsa halophila]MBK1633492.1 hypothetical protein [Thiohalocapsa halophila]
MTAHFTPASFLTWANLNAQGGLDCLSVGLQALVDVTMSAQPIPAPFQAGNRIIFRLTAPDAYRIPFTFVEALNQGNLADRSGRVFAAAAQEGQLYEVIASDDDPLDERIIGAGLFQETFRSKDGTHHQEELGALMVHPGARGYGIMTLLVKLMMVHRFMVVLPARGEPGSEDNLAHVLDGNPGPIHGLTAAGFVPDGEVHVHAGELDATLSHMMQPGEDFVRAHAYRFDPTALDALCTELSTFQREGRRLGNTRTAMTLPVDFSSLLPRTRG